MLSKQEIRDTIEASMETQSKSKKKKTKKQTRNESDGDYYRKRVEKGAI